MVKTGTVTVLFTDLVGSTEIASQLGAEAADDLRHKHAALLRDAIAGHGDNEVKHLGDGLVAAFSGAADAVGCAVAIQRAVELHTRHGGASLSIRVGLSAGDVTREGGDVFGEPVIEASRLCALAGGGQILAGDVVRLLVNSRGGHDFVSLGERELKRLPEPRPVCEVGWAPAEDAPGVPLPTVLARAPAVGLVGRTNQRERLARGWKRTSEGALRVVLLTGEPGIGKTRLAPPPWRALGTTAVQPCSSAAATTTSAFRISRSPKHCAATSCTPRSAHAARSSGPWPGSSPASCPSSHRPARSGARHCRRDPDGLAGPGSG